MSAPRLFPTRSGRLQDIDESREVDGGLEAWAANWSKERRRYEAARIFIPC